ncbi:alpha/beta hydrolase [Beijerinckia mobilis]|uniref:alpha/beta hydrolase n=1 Tax=Beijerinckia mobilis TaxID=231434 RepID=UPI000AF4D057|nr:alpha/beta hydrolase [Beijerinckia mobilis]
MEGFLTPVAASVPGTSHVDLLVVTTRLPTKAPGVLFSGARAPKASFADITISIPPDSNRQIGEVQWPRTQPGNPLTDFVAVRTDIVDRDTAIRHLHESIVRTHRRHVLLFVHGFNNKFDDAVFRFAQIIHDSNAQVTPVLFTWPSRGSILAYGYDRESANFSRTALEDTLRFLAKDPDVQEVSILAHSMGNWVALEALRQMAIRDGRIAPKIRNVLLASPDVDVDNAREQINDMGPNRPRFVLFVAQNDHALQVSQRIWGGPRLGAVNPDVEPMHSTLEQERIKVVNMTDIKSSDPLNHGTFAQDPEIVQLIGTRILQGQTISDSRAGLGDLIIERATDAATSVGTVAGLAVSAPVAVIDPATREHYGDQINALGEHIGDTMKPQ